MSLNPAPDGGADPGDRDRSGSGSPGADRAPGRSTAAGSGESAAGRRAGDCSCSCGCHDDADGIDGIDGEGAAGRVPPPREGVAPSRSEVDGIDWSGGPSEAALGGLFEACDAIDGWRRRQVESLIRALDLGAAEETFGVPLEVALSQTGRATAFETRRLLRAARVLAKMPAVRSGFMEGWLSWPQVDAVCHHSHRLPVARWDEIDRLVAERMVAAKDAEADALVEEVQWAAAKIREQRRAERNNKSVESDQLRLQGRVDGSGELHGEYGPDRFPLVEAAIDHAARELLADVPDPDDGLSDDADDAMVTEAYRHAARLAGRNAAARAAALFELVTGRDHDTLRPLHVDPDAVDPCGSDAGSGESVHERDRSGGGGRVGTGSPARRCDGGCGGRGVVDRPGMVLTAPLASLLDGSVPATVVSRLTARMQVTAAAARRLAAATDVDVRLVVLDEGRPVGVGRATSVAPGWLRDAVIATQPTDTAPCSNTPAVLCDMEHAVAFDQGGHTDVVNVAPVSRRWHTRKTSGAIDLHRDPDTGIATWTATTSGYTVVTWPSPQADMQFAQRTARPGSAGSDDTGRTARLTPDALRHAQDAAHPVEAHGEPSTADLDIEPDLSDLVGTVTDAHGHVLHDGRAPP